VERPDGAGWAGETKKMNVVPEKADQSENAKLKIELVACEKEKRSLNDLVRHIGETVINHFRTKG
jgi:hypothetical protein